MAGSYPVAAAADSCGWDRKIYEKTISHRADPVQRVSLAGKRAENYLTQTKEKIALFIEKSGESPLFCGESPDFWRTLIKHLF